MQIYLRLKHERSLRNKMKILVLMPCDEQHVFAAMSIYKALPKEIKEQCFPMPMFMDYLIQTKIVGNWVFAFFDAMISMQNVYKTALQNNDDLIVIGTAPKELEFDIVFSFQEIETKESYKDNFLEKVIKPCVKEDMLLHNMVNNLYDINDIKLALYNSIASADLLSAYLKTDVKDKLDKLKKEYELKLKRGVTLDGFSNI